MSHNCRNELGALAKYLMLWSLLVPMGQAQLGPPIPTTLSRSLTNLLAGLHCLLRRASPLLCPDLVGGPQASNQGLGCQTSHSARGIHRRMQTTPTKHHILNTI